MNADLPPARKPLWPTCMTGALLLLVAYAASPVPVRVLVHRAGRQCESGLHSLKVGLESFYQPLWWLAERNSWVDWFYEAQMEFCRERGWLPYLGYSTDVTYGL